MAGRIPIFFRKRFLVVSHDFEFLDKIANRICDIDNDTITKYYGTYSEFLRKRHCCVKITFVNTQHNKRRLKEQRSLSGKISLDEKRKWQEGGKNSLIEWTKWKLWNRKRLSPFSFSCFTADKYGAFTGQTPGSWVSLSSSIDIDFSIKGGQKVVITGFNGIGKSTLLKTLIGQIPSMQGHFKFSDQVALGYFEQDLIWDEPEQTPIQIVSNVHPDMVIKDVRNI